jgi:hypothetical protein
MFFFIFIIFKPETFYYNKFQKVLLQQYFNSDANIATLKKELEQKLMAGHVTPRAAAETLFEQFRGQRK